MELGETADPPAVSAAVWAGMAAVRGASAVHGVRDFAHPDASRDASVACVFLGSRAVCGIRFLHPQAHVRVQLPEQAVAQMAGGDIFAPAN